MPNPFSELPDLIAQFVLGSSYAASSGSSERGKIDFLVEIMEGSGDVYTNAELRTHFRRLGVTDFDPVDWLQKHIQDGTLRATPEDTETP